MKEMILKQKKRILIGAGLLIIFIVIGVTGYNMMQASKAKSLEALAAAAEKDVSLNFWGEVKYDKVYDISIDFPSIVTDIKVKEGDQVSRGQVLVALDISEYLGTMDKLQQKLAADQAGLINTLQDTGALAADIEQLKKDISVKTEEFSSGTNADMKILQTSLELAKQEVETANRDVQSNQALYDNGAVSKSTLDQYKDVLAQREKALTDVENNIEKTKRALETELDQLSIALKSKQAQLNQVKNSNSANAAQQNSSVAISQLDLELMKNKSVKDYLNTNQIISCVQNGIVQNIGVVNGTRLGVQNTPTRVLQLIDADSIVVSAEVDEEFIKSVTLGKAVRIVPVSNSSLSIPGVVTQISNVAVEKDGKRIIKVQVKPQDPEGTLKPGYSVDVYLPVD